MTQYVLKIFQDDERAQFRVVDRGGEPWFVLADVCKKLDIAQTAAAARILDEDEKDVLIMHTPGGKQPMTVINESGLYSLIIRSRKESARNFRKWVTAEVLPAIRKTGSYHGGTPAFIKRANDNWDRVDAGYFSVINELAVIVVGRLERVGHIMADKGPDGRELRPDVSVGQRFAKWLEDNHPTLSTQYKTYRHRTPEAEVEARQYPNSMLGLFRDYVETVWWPYHFEGYIKNRILGRWSICSVSCPLRKRLHEMEGGLRLPFFPSRRLGVLPGDSGCPQAPGSRRGRPSEHRRHVAARTARNGNGRQNVSKYFQWLE